MNILEQPAIQLEVTPSKELLKTSFLDLKKQYETVYGKYEQAKNKYIAFQQRNNAEPLDYQETGIEKMSYEYDENASEDELGNIISMIKLDIDELNKYTERTLKLVSDANVLDLES